MEKKYIAQVTDTRTGNRVGSDVPFADAQAAVDWALQQQRRFPWAHIDIQDKAQG